MTSSGINGDRIASYLPLGSSGDYREEHLKGGSSRCYKLPATTPHCATKADRVISLKEEEFLPISRIEGMRAAPRLQPSQHSPRMHFTKRSPGHATSQTPSLPGSLAPLQLQVHDDCSDGHSLSSMESLSLVEDQFLALASFSPSANSQASPTLVSKVSENSPPHPNQRCTETVVVRKSDPRIQRNHFTTTLVHHQPYRYKETVELISKLVNISRCRSFILQPVLTQLQCYDYAVEWTVGRHSSEIVLHPNGSQPSFQFQCRLKKDPGLEHYRSEIHLTLNNHERRSRDKQIIDRYSVEDDVSNNGIFDSNVAFLTTAQLYFNGDNTWTSANGYVDSSEEDYEENELASSC